MRSAATAQLKHNSAHVSNLCWVARFCTKLCMMHLTEHELGTINHCAAVLKSVQKMIAVPSSVVDIDVPAHWQSGRCTWDLSTVSNDHSRFGLAVLAAQSLNLLDNVISLHHCSTAGQTLNTWAWQVDMRALQKACLMLTRKQCNHQKVQL